MNREKKVRREREREKQKTKEKKQIRQALNEWRKVHVSRKVARPQPKTKEICVHLAGALLPASVQRRKMSETLT